MTKIQERRQLSINVLFAAHILGNNIIQIDHPSVKICQCTNFPTVDFKDIALKDKRNCPSCRFEIPLPNEYLDQFNKESEFGDNNTVDEQIREI